MSWKIQSKISQNVYYVYVENSWVNMLGPTFRYYYAYLFSFCFFHRVSTKVRIITGYTIPAGWTFVVCPSSVHLDPNKYEDPLTFNPWRWKVS